MSHVVSGATATHRRGTPITYALHPIPPCPRPLPCYIVEQLQPGGNTGLALEWEPWNWDLWDTPMEPDDDDSVELWREKLDQVLEQESPVPKRSHRNPWFSLGYLSRRRFRLGECLVHSLFDVIRRVEGPVEPSEQGPVGPEHQGRRKHARIQLL